MKVFELTRALVDIESITGNEEAVGSYLFDCLCALAARFKGPWSACLWKPAASMCSRSGATGPPSRFPLTWIRCRHSSPRARTTTHIWGRGACDTKGIIAAMITAAEALLEAGERDFGLLFVVGEERNSAGRYTTPPHRRAARATSSTASPPKTSWRSAPRARCGMK